MNERGLKRFMGRTERMAAALILVFLCLFFLYLVPSAFVETSTLTTENPSGEYVEFSEDNFFLNVIVLVLQLSAMYLYYHYSRRDRAVRMEIVLMAWLFIVGTAFIVSAKLRPPVYSDSFLVTYGAQHAARGDYSLVSENYFRRFPFQFGYVLYSELFFRVAGLFLKGRPEGYAVIALQEINLLWLMAMLHALLEITDLLFGDERLRKLMMLLSFFCLPPILSVSFLYGNIPAFSCGILAAWTFLLFMKGERLKHGILCALCLALAVSLKLNLLIVCVAIAGVWLIKLLNHFSLKSFLCLALSLVCVFTLSPLPRKSYEHRTGISYGGGIPMIAWMAMGMDEGHAAPGWYKEEHTVTAFEWNRYDPKATAEDAKLAIRQRLAVFREDPAYCVSFFARKLRSQWNEPSYGSLWVNQVFPSYSEKGKVFDFLCGSGQHRSAVFMNTYQQLIFLGVLLGLFRLWRKKDLLQSLLPLILLGGLLYHFLFEAKSQYAMPYFILMLPIAACGFAAFFRKVETWS